MPSAATMADDLPDMYAYYALYFGGLYVYWDAANADNTVTNDKMAMVPITGDGTYEVPLDLTLFTDDTFDYPLECFKVQIPKNTEAPEGTKMTLKSCNIDGTDLPITGEEANLFCEWPDAAGDPGVQISSSWVFSNIDYDAAKDLFKNGTTFTAVIEISGMSSAAPDDTTTDAGSDDAPATAAVIPMLAVPAALAIAGVVASKKRK